MASYFAGQLMLLERTFKLCIQGKIMKDMLFTCNLCVFFYCLWIEITQLPPINICVLVDQKKKKSSLLSYLLITIFELRYTQLGFCAQIFHCASNRRKQNKK